MKNLGLQTPHMLQGLAGDRSSEQACPHGFDIGTKVRSIAVGRKPAFDGVIASKRNAGWHVRCPLGFHWYREIDELRIIREDASAAEANRDEQPQDTTGIVP